MPSSAGWKAAAAVATLALCTVPAHAGTVLDVISGNSELSTLASLVTEAGLDSALSGAGPFTVFAPTNAAFGKVPPYKVTYLKDAANVGTLASILKYHVASGSLDVSKFVVNQSIPTLQGSDVFVEYITGTTTLGLDSSTCEKDVHFVGAEMSASNGMVQMIDTVLFPANEFCPNQVFFVEQRNQSRIGYVGYDCRAKGTHELTDLQYKPVGLAVDMDDQRVFWSNDQNAKPYDSWLSTLTLTNHTPNVFLNDLTDPQGMDTDTKNKKLYFTEHQGNRVNRANYDGSDVETLRVTEKLTEFPADVVVDEDMELVFMAIQSQPDVLEGKLAVMAYNGSNYKVLAKDLVQNYGLCLDKLAKHVYYIQGGHGGSISCFPYGAHPCPKEGVVISGLEYPYMCAVDNLWAPYGGPTKILFSEANYPGNVYSMTSDGTDLQKINSELYAPMGVKLGCVKP